SLFESDIDCNVYIYLLFKEKLQHRFIIALFFFARAQKKKKKGSLLFSKQELPTLWLVVVSLFLSAFMFYRVYFISGVAYESVLWNGIGFLWLLFLVCLIRIWLGAQQLQSIQKVQERFIAEQRFYLKCRLTMKSMKEKAHTWAHSKNLTAPGEPKPNADPQNQSAQPLANASNGGSDIEIDETEVEMVERHEDGGANDEKQHDDEYKKKTHYCD
ncbi:hypothetical protein RFI_32418, partial [Reticulomyxa filosa]